LISFETPTGGKKIQVTFIVFEAGYHILSVNHYRSW